MKPKLTKKQIIAELRDQRKSVFESFKDHRDGTLHNEEDIRLFESLTIAIRTIRKYHNG